MYVSTSSEYCSDEANGASALRKVEMQHGMGGPGQILAGRALCRIAMALLPNTYGKTRRCQRLERSPAQSTQNRDAVSACSWRWPLRISPGFPRAPNSCRGCGFAWAALHGSFQLARAVHVPFLPPKHGGTSAGPERWAVLPSRDASQELEGKGAGGREGDSMPSKGR